MARPTTYSPTYLPAVKAAAFFGATHTEIADYLGVPIGSFARWITAEPELREALKHGTEHANARVVESLYQNALGGNVTAQIFWLKNRLPAEWRDVQNIAGEVGHYIISDRPLTEDQWIEQRTRLLDLKASPVLPDSEASSEEQGAK